MFVLLAILLSNDAIFDTQAGLEFGRDLVWSHRLGAFDRTERAAFIVDDGEGNLQCVAWPQTNASAEARFIGHVPKGTVAIIHTHPITVPLPSVQDEHEATRLGITVYALTPLAVTKVMPSHDEPLVVRKGEWLDPPPNAHHCR